MPTTTATLTPAATWTIDATHSNVEFSVRHLMISTARGRFASVKGRVTLNDDEPAQSAVDITIDAASIDTRDQQRDAHLRSADFFNVERFPELTFRSTRVERAADGRYLVTGDLTIAGVTRAVVLEATAEGRTVDPWGNERVGFSATTRVKRSDFGLTWNIAIEAGGVAVGDEVKIAIDVELVKDKDQK